MLPPAATAHQVHDVVGIVPADADGRQVRVQERALGRSRVTVDRHVDGVPPAVRVAGERIDIAIGECLAVEERSAAGH
jgi:hypothetical protein